MIVMMATLHLRFVPVAMNVLLSVLMQMNIKFDSRDSGFLADRHMQMITVIQPEFFERPFEFRRIYAQVEARGPEQGRKGFYGKSARTFTLAHEIDDALAGAKYEDGVLRLTLPKKPGSTAKKLAIQ